MSIDGDTGNVTASDISTTGSLLTGGDITTTGDISTTGAVTTGDVSFALSPAGAVTVLGSGGFSGTLYTPGRIYETTTDGAGSGLRVLVTYVEYGPGSARSLPSPSGGTIKIIDGGSGYSDGDAVYIQHYGDEQGGITAILQAQSVTGAPVTSGTITANTSVWSFDESGDTTVPGDVLLPDNTAIYNVDANTAVFTSNVISDATSIYLTDEGNVAVYASSSVVLETNSDGNVASQWSFNDNGDIIFPNGATLRDSSQNGYDNALAFGYFAGHTSQGENAVAIGIQAGSSTQSDGAIAIGPYAGYFSQGTNTVAIGVLAGNSSQSTQGVAIGTLAGADTQSAGAVAIGYTSGQTAQKENAVAIGVQAGSDTQGVGAVAIGLNAGYSLQGIRAVAIGADAGDTNQANNSIIINATNSALNMTTANTFTVAPVRNDTGNISTSMYYNTTTKEVTYGPGYSNVQVNSYLPTYSGNVGNVTVSGTFGVFGNVLVANTYTPILSNSAGITGQITWGANYIYVCVATNTWKRANISTW
jgi:hypothetical protein